MWRSLRGSRQVPRDFAEQRRCPCRSPLTAGPRIQEDTEAPLRPRLARRPAAPVRRRRRPRARRWQRRRPATSTWRRARGSPGPQKVSSRVVCGRGSGARGAGSLCKDQWSLRPWRPDEPGAWVLTVHDSSRTVHAQFTPQFTPQFTSAKNKAKY